MKGTKAVVHCSADSSLPKGTKVQGALLEKVTGMGTADVYWMNVQVKNTTRTVMVRRCGKSKKS